jgi:ribosomal protection tetracycline resistance protein
MRTLNLGILAHVDAGKTTLTERLLHTAGAIDRMGSVDRGTTQTDSLALERRRGITIKAAVASFVVGDVTVNLLDTPGHPDFIAEVERVLTVLDGAVLVVSAVEGVQAQTRILMRTLTRLAIPTLVFVNKIDRAGARGEPLLGSIAERLGTTLVPMVRPTGLGSSQADVHPWAATDLGFATSVTEALAEHDEEILGAYVSDDATLTPGQLERALSSQVQSGQVQPAYFGSAATGAGVGALVDGITRLLPTVALDEAGPLSGLVFKVERGPAGERIASVRLFSGELGVRERVPVQDRLAKVTALEVYDGGPAVKASIARAGQIARVWGLADVRIGDVVGEPPSGVAATEHHFAPPTLEAVVRPVRDCDRGRLYAALTQLSEQDPLIDLRRDEVTGETSLTLYGEVQKEVIQATLAEEFGVEVTFHATTTICVERPLGAGEAFELIGTDTNPFLATVGLRVEPAPDRPKDSPCGDEGTGLALEVELGSMPPAFFRAVEESAGEALRHGNHGWEVVDWQLTMTHSGYWARQSHAHGTFDASMSSTAGDFRELTRVIVARALARAGTVVLEPIHRFHLEAPADTTAPVLALLGRLAAIVRGQSVAGPIWTVEGDLAAAAVHGLQQALPGVTRGEGFVESSFDHHRPVRGRPPSRPGR